MGSWALGGSLELLMIVMVSCSWCGVEVTLANLGRPRHPASLLAQQRVEEVRQNSCTEAND